jgi:ATP-dependent DNA helicase RecQ
MATDVGEARDLERTLRDRFGLEHFRPGQREVIGAVLDRRDVLCVMPTGGGKSLCYQLPALVQPGVTLVVSPLIALMKDQVDSLVERGLRATYLNSTLDPADIRIRLIEVENGRYDLVYVAPERFRSARFVEAMARIRPALLAVDEAHCISEWGHDFRPDYARLGQARRALGMPPCIALTATATDLVRRDIADQLDLREPELFITGFDRPNLSYHAVEARKDADKLAALADVLRRNPGPAIVYTNSRKRCEYVGQFLGHELRRPVAVYHAGLAREERTDAQDRFMGGEADVVVATNAFGMGVDKPDIRSVVHFNLPGTLEAYYQEAGRAGRDGEPAECVLLYAPGDRFLQEMFIENEYPPPEAVYRVYDFLRAQDADPIEMTQAEIKEAIGLDLNESAVGTALKILEGAGALERLRPRENMAIIRINAEPDEPSLVERLDPRATTQRGILMGLEALVDRRFGEPVYFHPDDFAARLGHDRAALTRTLRALIHEAGLPLDYIPPFRGNAVRVLDRARRPRDIAIDFSALNQRKRQEYDKLDRMVRYAEARTCRRAYILGYFGDASGTGCGRCDNCRRTGTDADAPAGRVPIETPAGREVILKALSGVARARGRFGKTVVAQMLAGSGAEKMDRWGLRNLSTFGVLADFLQSEVVALLDALTEAGLAEAREVDRFRPVLHLSDAGRAVMLGQDTRPLALALPGPLAAKVKLGGLQRLGPRAAAGAGEFEPAEFDEFEPPEGRPAPRIAREAPPRGDDEEPGPDPGGDPLHERLRLRRLEWAREAKVPAYCVFPNATLDALVRERPTTPADLARVKGLGPSKLERYGAELLALIREEPPPTRPPSREGAAPARAGTPAPRLRGEEPGPGLDDEGEARPSGDEPAGNPALPASWASSSTAPGSTENLGRTAAADNSPGAPGPATAYIPTEEWTWRLLDRGFSAADAAAIRGLEPSAILRHATWTARQGKPVPLAAFLPDDLLARWEAWHAARGDSPPDDPALDPALWALFVACKRAARASG